MTPTLPQLQDAIHNAPVTDHQTTRQDVELTITLPVTLAWDSEEHDDGRHISIRAATVTPEPAPAPAADPDVAFFADLQRTNPKAYRRICRQAEELTAR